MHAVNLSDEDNAQLMQVMATAMHIANTRYNGSYMMMCRGHRYIFCFGEGIGQIAFPRKVSDGDTLLEALTDALASEGVTIDFGGSDGAKN